MNKNKVMENLCLSQEKEKGELGHLHQFLQDQIGIRSARNSSRSSKQKSFSCRHSKNNNSIIEKAATMKHDLRAIQQLAEQHGAANCAKINTGKNFN
jgi:hypothetical protein